MRANKNKGMKTQKEKESEEAGTWYKIWRRLRSSIQDLEANTQEGISSSLWLDPSSGGSFEGGISFLEAHSQRGTS